jgi:pimeloyl-ACP methyl ester carboxylesterase
MAAGNPGELIRFEQAYDYHLSYEASAYRILYHSRTPEGNDVAVSGVVLVPDATPPAGGWPIIAWAHDFTGSARACAPSLLKNLSQGPLLSMYASLGYAVVAPDYAGLGTSLPHAVLDVRSNALDLIHSIPAARAALPQLGTRWVAAGYSQGASVAVGVAEAESEMNNAGYLGALAIAGAAEPQEMFELFARGPESPLLVVMAQGVRTVIPAFRVEEILTEKAMPLYQHLTHECELRSGPEVTPADLLRPGWQNSPTVKDFFSRNTLGGKPARGPLLVISGEADTIIPSTLTGATVAKLCHQKDRVLFVKYPGLDGSGVLANSVSEQSSWIHARFSGLSAPSNCQ